MSRRLFLFLGLLAAGTFALLGSVLLFPVAPRISVNGQSDGVLAGVLFWMAITVIASSLPVLMPNGSYLDLSFAPVVASMCLGGPAAVGFVSLFGTTQVRELRGQIPWYGIVANRGVIVGPAIVGAFVVQEFPSRDMPYASLVGTSLGAACFFGLNVSLTAAIVSLREGAPISKKVRSAGGAYLNLLALAPIAWLMAQMYIVSWWSVLLFAVPLYTTRLAYQRFVEVREMFTETVRSLAEAVDKRDKFTSGHSHRVQEISMDIGRAMHCSDDEMEALEWGGLLHDIGKIGIPDAVLLKQERLSREERATMNSHPVLGAEIITPVTRLAPELPIIRHHHEWFNGSGYPDRLVGDEIPKLARILHVADAFEAMTAQRPYRMVALTPEQALAELRKFGGIQFDPQVVDAFVKTRWARGVKDPGRDEVRDVPLIGQAAGTLAGMGATSGAGPA
jgi:hypothetical protein